MYSEISKPVLNEVTADEKNQPFEQLIILNSIHSKILSAWES